MTILSNKKTSSTKQEIENIENKSQHGNTQLISLKNISTHNQIVERTLENCLNSSPSALIAPWPPGPYEKNYDDAENYELIDSGSSHNKRCQMISPLRTICGNKYCSSFSNPGSSNSKLSCNNSEYDYSQKSKKLEAQWLEDDRIFEKKMRKKGFLIKKMKEDPSSLFCAVADQIYGDQEMHQIVRKHCMDYIALNNDYFSQYVPENFNTYISMKRLDQTPGNHIEIQALSEIYNRKIEVYYYGIDPINVFHGLQKSDNEPIRLSHQRENQFNIIENLQKAKIGFGLPTLNAENDLMKDVIRQSEDLQIEEAMLEDKLRVTDWEATNDALLEQVAKISYLEFLKEDEKRQKVLEKEMAPSSNATESDFVFKINKNLTDWEPILAASQQE